MSLESVFKLSLVMNMIDNLSGPMASVASRVGADVSKLDALGAGFGSVAKAGAAMQETGAQIVGAVLAPVEATFETRRAIGELASLGVKDLGAVEDAARAFSDQWAGTSKADFISAAYDIKSGIASLSDEGVAQFTELSGLTAKATKSTVGEMTSLFATGYGIYKGYYDDLTDLEFGEMFSAGIARSVQQFKTDGSQMAGAIQTLGASATTANVPLEEQLSILGMLQATMGGSEAGTKYKAFLQSAAKAGKALGLSFVDANNQLLSMPEILDALRGKFGDTMDAAEKMKLQEAFGTAEAVALIDMLYTKTDDLQGNILDMYDALGSGTGVATEMANAINETEPERFERLTQRIQNIKESIGNSLLPTINDLMGKGEVVLTKVGSWIEENQELVKIIMLIVLAVGGFLSVAGTAAVVVGGVGLAVTKAISAFKMLKAGFGIARAALSPLIGSVWSFTAALLANPVTWVVIGIVALIAAIVLLYNKCEWFRNLVGNILNFFREKLGAAFETAQAVFSGIGSVIGSVMGAARDTVAEKLDNMRSAYESHGGGIRGAAAAAIEGVKGYYMAGFTFLDNLTGGKLTAIKDKFSEKLGPIKDISGTIMSAARDTVAEKLDNMRSAYESHGGGIRGAAAAAIEGVKGIYTAGFTFLDNLTGGKLTAIKDKFISGVMNIASGVRERFEGVKTAFSDGIANIKNLVTGAVTWFFESGKKVVSTFADGIRSAFTGAVDTVKGGLQRIRNMLPFSDAKEGPLSTLTLSGQRTMTTYASGLEKATNAPAQAMEKGLGTANSVLEKAAFNPAIEPIQNSTVQMPPQVTENKLGVTGNVLEKVVRPPVIEPIQDNIVRAVETDEPKPTLKREPVKKVSFSREGESRDNKSGGSGESDGAKRITIQKLIISADLKKIKDLQQILEIVKEVEDFANANGSEETVDDPDAVSITI